MECSLLLAFSFPKGFDIPLQEKLRTVQFIENFRDTLYQPIRRHLTDKIYRTIEGTTDSEHIFALIANDLTINNSPLDIALDVGLKTLAKLATLDNVPFSANVVISDGNQLVASRFARGVAAPSLYWLWDDSSFSNSTIVASEPLFPGDWHPFAENTILYVDKNSKPRTELIFWEDNIWAILAPIPH